MAHGDAVNDAQPPLPKSLTELPPAPPEEYPRPFGNYMLLSPLARGGMGEVFLAKHGSVRGLEKHCVVKTLRPHLTDDREYTTRFIDEARIVVQLGHKTICHVFDVGTVGERYYLAMEYIAGKDLRALAHDVGDKGGVVNPGLALHMVCEVLEALDYAHRHVDAASGKPLLLVHRDVSPQNVMLSWEGEVKLIDFGLAASTLKMEQTSPNVVMGKLAYMAPEQVRGEKVDGRADMFAVAVILYELLVGERFYEGRSPYEIWGLAAQGGFRPRGWDALDADMKAILDKALAGSATVRHASCLELREALQGYRFARGLHGDSPMLRALMQQVYADEIEASRRTLVELSRRDPLQARPSGVFSVSTEPTVSLARSPSQSLPQLAPNEVTEATEMAVKAMFGPRRSQPLFTAAAVVVAVVAVIVAGVSWVGRGDAVPPPVATAPAAPPHVDAPAPPPAHVDAPAPVVDTPAPPAPPTPPAPSAPAHPRKGDAFPPLRPSPPVVPQHFEHVDGADAAKVDVDAAKVDAAKAEAAKADAAKADAAKADAPAEKPKATRGWGEKLDDVAVKCPGEPCYTELLPHRHDYADLHKMSPAEASAWIAQVKKCLAKCGITN